MITTLLQLAGLFAVLGLLSVGGGNAILADMQTATVVTYHWMSDREFLDIFAISRAAPGPGTLVVALIGLKAAGLAGAAVAFVAMLGPPFVLVHCGARVWHHARNTGWYGLLEQALAPVAIGLSFAGGISLLVGVPHALLALVITAVAAVLLAWTEIHPVLVMAAAALLFIVGG